MPDLLLYLLKANVALLLFYLAYHVVLRRLTFYTLNRLFLVLGLLFSALYPLLDLSTLFHGHQQLARAAAYAGALPAWTVTGTPEQASAFDYWQLPVYLFWAGTGIMASRLALQFAGLYRIHASSAPAMHQGVAYRATPGITEAFSFWQSIYLNPRQHNSQELGAILRHELAHVRGWHTLDVLLAEVSAVFCWFNPGVWLLKKALKENLEFIADRQVVNGGADRKAYQYLLLKITGPSEPQIATQFHFPSLKTRIVMMNKKQSSLLQIARYAVLVPLIAAPTLLLSARGEAASQPPAVQQQQATASIPDSVVYYIDGEKATPDAVEKLDPNEIQSINVLKGPKAAAAFGDNTKSGVISITTKKNKDAPEVLRFNEELKQATPAQEQQGEASVFIPEQVAYYKNNLPADYKDFLQRNPSVKQAGWKFSDGKGSELLAFVVYLKSGATEVYDYNHSPHIPTAEAKYGELPQLPPPPPPVRVKISGQN